MEEIKEGLRERIEKYEKELADLKDQVREKEELLQSCKVLYASETVQVTGTAHRTFSKMKLADAAYEVLKGMEEAHAKDITNEVIKRGREVGGTKPFQTLAAVLRQDLRFEKLGKNKYRVRQKESAPF
jgi:hypothetical protein